MPRRDSPTAEVARGRVFGAHLMRVVCRYPIMRWLASLKSCHIPHVGLYQVRKWCSSDTGAVIGRPLIDPLKIA